MPYNKQVLAIAIVRSLAKIYRYGSSATNTSVEKFIAEYNAKVEPGGEKLPEKSTVYCYLDKYWKYIQTLGINPHQADIETKLRAAYRVLKLRVPEFTYSDTDKRGALLKSVSRVIKRQEVYKQYGIAPSTMTKYLLQLRKRFQARFPDAAVGNTTKLCKLIANNEEYSKAVEDIIKALTPTARDNF
jgi:hypothetical protein